MDTMDIYSITNLITLDAKELASRIMYFSFIQEALSLEKSIRAVDPSGRLLVAVLAEIADLIISGTLTFSRLAFHLY